MLVTLRGLGVGNGPIQVAALAGTLSAETVKQLSDESSGPVGRLLGHADKMVKTARWTASRRTLGTLGAG